MNPFSNTESVGTNEPKENKMLNWVNKLLGSKPINPMEPKDPMDWKLTKNSKPWKVENYCPNCKATVYHDEQMAYICNTCGGHNRKLILLRRSFRKIWNGKKWITQYKYGNTENDYELGE